MPYKVCLAVTIFLLINRGTSLAQYRYSPFKRIVSLEAFGVGPMVHLAAETPFAYRKSSFFSVQAGLGLFRQTESISFNKYGISVGSALTHCILLNRGRSSCDPRPKFHRWETYFESGLTGSLFPTRFKITDSSPAGGTIAASQLLVGFRFHYIGVHNNMVFKIRYTPYLSPGFPQWAGLVVGIGVR